MQFSQIPGKENLKDVLLASVKSDAVSHAQLFLGPEGNGGLALALAYAQYLNCEQKRESDSCGQCTSCIKAQKFSHPDIQFTFPVIKLGNEPPLSDEFLTPWREQLSTNPFFTEVEWLQRIGAENKQGNITAKECREMVRKISLKAFEGSYKIHIVYLPERLQAAGNILLKTLEEPPLNSVFILVSNSSSDLLTTILSRTQILSVPGFSSDQINSYLKGHTGIEDQEARTLANIVDGNLAQALELSQSKAGSNFKLLSDWFKAILNLQSASDRASYSKLTNDFCASVAKLGRTESKAFLKYTLYILRQAVRKKAGNEYNFQDHEKIVIDNIAVKIGLDQIYHISELINNLHYSIERNANTKVLYLNATVQMSKMVKKEPEGFLN